MLSNPERTFFKTIATCPWKWLMGIVLLLTLFVIVDNQQGWLNTLDLWQHVSIQTLAIAFTFYLCSHLARAIRIYDYKFRGKKHAFFLVVKLSALHQFFNNLLPMRMGEAAFPLLMKRYFDLSWKNSLGSLIWLRVLDIGILGIFVTLLVIFYAPMSVVIYLGLTSFLLLLIFATSFKYLTRFSIIKRFVILLGIYAPKNIWQITRLVLWTSIGWACKLTALSILILSLSSVPIITAFAALVSTELGSILPVHGIAGAGTYEIAFLMGASIADFDSATLLALAVNTHIFVFVSTLITTLLFCAIKQLPSDIRVKTNAELRNCRRA